VTSGFDRADHITEEIDLTNLRAAGALPPMTPETARRLAAILAPHLVAMRAVTAGTRYESWGGGLADGGGLAADGEGGAADRGGLTADPGSPPLSPATKIFIAGTLERISA
jgi:hypothetical protein